MASRTPALDLLRAIAIVWVMLHHLQVYGYSTLIPAIAGPGWIGVDLFFALSGYLIGSQLLKHYAAGTRPSLGSFYFRRALRILPAYWVVLAFYQFVPAFRESPGMQPMWQFLTFTENLLIDPAHNGAFSHAWSLCVEEHFYLLFPLMLMALMWRPNWKVTAAVFVCLLLGGMALREYVWLHDIVPARAAGAPGPVLNTLYVEKIYYPTYMRMDGLLAGVGVAAVRWFLPAVWARAMRHSNRLLLVGVAVFAAAFWFMRYPQNFLPAVFGFPLLSAGLALIVGACTSPDCLLARIRVPAAGILAAMAYSLYLVHKPAFHLLQLGGGGRLDPHGLPAFLAYVLAAMVAGAVLYWLVERPFLNLRDRVVRRERSASADGARQGVRA